MCSRRRRRPSSTSSCSSLAGCCLQPEAAAAIAGRQPGALGQAEEGAAEGGHAGLGAGPRTAEGQRAGSEERPVGGTTSAG